MTEEEFVTKYQEIIDKQEFARNEELKSAIEFYKNQNRLYRLECEKWQEDFLECFYNLW